MSDQNDKKSKVFTYIAYGILTVILILGGVAGMSGNSEPSYESAPTTNTDGSW